MLADPGRLEQVIGNLVANALRHTPAGGTIHLDAAMADGGYRLAVEDSGEGIPPAHLPHVFDRFYKTDSARTRRHRRQRPGAVDRQGDRRAARRHHRRRQPAGPDAFVILLPRAAAEVGPPADQSRPSANL